MECLGWPNETQLQFYSDNFNLHLGSPGSLVDFIGDLCWSGANYGAHNCTGNNFVYLSANHIYLPSVTVGNYVFPANPDAYFVESYFGQDAHLELEAQYVTPEPSTFVLLGSGALGAIGTMYRRRRTA